MKIREDYISYIESEFESLTVKSVIDDYIIQVVELSDRKLNYSQAKKLVLNFLSSDACAKVISDFYHTFMDEPVAGE